MKNLVPLTPADEKKLWDFMGEKIVLLHEHVNLAVGRKPDLRSARHLIGLIVATRNKLMASEEARQKQHKPEPPMHPKTQELYAGLADAMERGRAHR